MSGVNFNDTDSKAGESGGGGTPLPLMNMQSGRTNNGEFFGFAEKTDYVYTRNSISGIDRHKKQGGQIILNNDTTSNTLWKSTVAGYYGLVSIDPTDDFLYYTTSTSSNIRMLTISTQGEISMTVTGINFGSNASLCTDGTFLYALSNNTTSMHKLSVSGTTATFVETITLPFIVNSTSSQGTAPLIHEGKLYYMSDSRIVVCDADGTPDYDIVTSLVSQAYLGYGIRGCFFFWNGYVMYGYGRNDSEDYVGIAFQIIENLN